MNDIGIDDRPTILIGGASSNVLILGDWAERAGLRCIGRIALHDLPARLDQVIALEALLIDLRTREPDLDLLQLVRGVRQARSAASPVKLIVFVDLPGLDEAVARFDDRETVFLCEPAPHDIVSLLVMTALTADRIAGHAPFHDATRDEESARIERLSEEVRRLATTIEQLTLSAATGHPLADKGLAYTAMRQMPAAPEATVRPRETRASGSAARNGPPTHAEIRALLRARRMREQFLPADLFADPAWDMILDLFAARLAGQRVSVSSLCIAASVPPTTALRWIRQLTERDLLSRIDDPEDGRRVFIDLTQAAAEAVLAWAQMIRRNGGLLAGASAG